MNEINKKLSYIISDESIPINERVARLQDIDQIRAMMQAYFESKTDENENTAVSTD